MRVLCALVLFVGVSCRGSERADLTQTHVTDLQQRIGALETAAAATPPPAWWCTAAGCTRERTADAMPRAWAWCRLVLGGQAAGSASGATGVAVEGCRETPGQCGAGCVGVR